VWAAYESLGIWIINTKIEKSKFENNKTNVTESITCQRKGIRGWTGINRLNDWLELNVLDGQFIILDTIVINQWQC
jgi:hypothetical protein